MPSTLSSFPFIANGSEATPELWNRIFSALSSNIATLDSSATVSLPSGNTLSVFSSVDASQHVHAGEAMGIGPTPSAVTTGAMTIAVRSDTSDYIHLEDTSGLRSDYLIGSRVGGTADGLNIWDISGSTMIVSFSKQSVRFFQNVVGPVFDTGGALADTINAATFGTGADSKESRIQAAINQASIDGIARVYVPANMYPYSAASVSFDTRVQMVREGGNWDVYDIQAYGAHPTAVTPNQWSTSAVQAAIHGAAGAGGGIVYVPSGVYRVSSITMSRKVTLRGSGGGRFLDSTEVCLLYQNDSTVTTVIFMQDQGGTGAIIENLQLGAASATNGGGIRIAGMEFCLVRNVSISGMSGFCIQVEGGNDTNMNAIVDCAITMTSIGTAIDIEGNSTGLDSTPYMTGCWVNADSPAAWISIKSTSSGLAPDSALFTNNRFIASLSTVTALYALSTNARFIGNRFENVAGGMNVLLAPPTGSQFAGEFIGNSWAASGGKLVWTDSANTPSTRLQEITSSGVYNMVPGTLAAPSLSFGSESSLGWFRSAASTIAAAGSKAIAIPMGTTYGRIYKPNDNIFAIGVNSTPAFGVDDGTVVSWRMFFQNSSGANDAIIFSHSSANGGVADKFSFDSTGAAALGSGVATNPGMGYISERSLGWYRSGVSRLGLSYGQLSIPDGSNTTPSIGLSSATSIGFYSSGAQTIAQSLGTFNLATNAVRLSMRTLAASAVTASAAKTNVATNEVVFTIGGASGVSLCISSGGTLYFFNSDGSAILA